jgi:hypothetical protein
MGDADETRFASVIPQVAVLGEVLDQQVGHRGIRHAVLAVASGDRTLSWAGAAGPAGPDGPPIKPGTPFRYASVTPSTTFTSRAPSTRPRKCPVPYRLLPRLVHRLRR